MTSQASRSYLRAVKTHAYWPANPFRHSQCRQLSRPILLQRTEDAHQQRQRSHFPASSFSTCSRRHASILSALADNRGAYNRRIRRGRGPGSGKGKTSGRGHGGQKSRGKPPPNFEGGQTPSWMKPVRGAPNPTKEDMAELNLDRLQSWVDQGRLNPNRPITLYELYKSGCTSSVRDGIKLLSRGQQHLKTPLHLIVSRASSSAIEAIEAVGGSVTTRFYSKFAIQKILRGESDPINSRLFVSTPITRLATSEGKMFRFALPDPVRRKDLEYYRDINKRGYLSYMVPEGQTPSLFFKVPGLGRKREDRGDAPKVMKENRLW